MSYVDLKRKMTYTDECLERAGKATKSPWKNSLCIGAIFDSHGDPIQTGGVSCDEEFQANAEFISHARQDVPELAKRLKKACEVLEKIADPRKRDHSEPDAYTELGCVMNLASEALLELEAAPGEK